MAALSDMVADLIKKIDAADLNDTKIVLEFSQKLKSLRLQAENLSGKSADQAVQRILDLLDEKKKQLATAALGV